MSGLAAACVAATAASATEDTFPSESTRVEILKWLAGASDLAPESVLIVTDDLLVAITARADGRGADRSTRLTLREEVISRDAATALGGRSIQLELDLDCTNHRVIVGARRIYEHPNLQGSVRITRSDNAWVATPADTVIDEVARAACSPQAPAPLIAAQAVANASPPVLDTAPAGASTAQPQPASLPASLPAPAPSPPPAPELRTVSADPPAVLHNPSESSGAPARGPAPRSEPAPRSAPAASAQRPAEYAVQIAAVDNADLAHDVWQTLKARLPDLIGPRTFAVEPVSTRGRTEYRALLLGFASASEATALCKTLRSRSVDCVLRQMK
ncbi:MAG: SPOR domain-containing protein [Caulobacteraceae bacterium]